MKRKLCEIGIILLFYLLQVSLGRVIRIGGIMPNFMIILPVLFGYLKGRKEGIFVGFCAGILYDLFFSDLLGFSALIFVIIGYISGMFYNNYEENSFVVPLIITAISTFSYEFLTSEKWLALDPRKLSVTVFAGDENAPRDEEAANYWKENGMPEDKIA